MTAENYKKLRKYEEELDLNRSIGLALLATDNGRTLDELSAVNEYFKRINAIRYHDYAVELMLDEKLELVNKKVSDGKLLISEATKEYNDYKAKLTG